MENGDISNEQITSSSYYSSEGGFQAWKGRLNYNKCWGAATENPSDPWIQVDLLRWTIVHGIITQGSYGQDEWVTNLQVQYGEAEDALIYILESGNTKVRFLFLRCCAFIQSYKRTIITLALTTATTTTMMMTMMMIMMNTIILFDVM